MKSFAEVGDDNDSCITDGSGDEGDAEFSHAAFNHIIYSAGVDNPVTPMAARSSCLAVNDVGRTKVTRGAPW